MTNSFPTLRSPDYYTEPGLDQLAANELIDPGYTARVPDFTIGRYGCGCIKFIGNTDVRLLDIDRIVNISGNEVVVYEDESLKPPVGEGLNKPAEVTLILDSMFAKQQSEDKLRKCVENQGAEFVSFNRKSGEWKFVVPHFSRFGLSDDEDEDDMVIDDAAVVVHNRVQDEVSNIDEDVLMDSNGSVLSHSLPQHLGLDPLKVREMRMLMFPVDEEEDVEDFDDSLHQRKSTGKEHVKTIYRPSLPARRQPVALLEYKSGSFDSNSPNGMLMAQQNRDMPLKVIKPEGFKLDLKRETPVTQSHTSHSCNIVDAGMFMGRSFGVGWGPNGVIVHCGTPVGHKDGQQMLSSVINVEKVAIDKVVRDENNKVSKELVDLVFDAPLSLHQEINHEMRDFEFGSYELRLQKVVADRLTVSEICRSYIDIIEKQLEVPELPSSTRLVLMHQVMTWELIKVLFSERENSGQSKPVIIDDDEEDMMQDTKEGGQSQEVDQEALPLIRRAEFSALLQESVCHRVQDDVSSLNDSDYLRHILLLLTGRQLDAAVELASSKGDIRLSCLLSQAGGSMVNRSDIARQLDIWKNNGLDFNFIENDRIRLYEFIAGNIHSALHDIKIDWKRFLGSLMWYKLQPTSHLPLIFKTYHHLLENGKAPYPLPIYIDEGPIEESMNWNTTMERFDLSYYLMLLHASENKDFGFLKTMFSAFSSTPDPLDYHMIWHQRGILEAIGAFNSNDLNVLDVGLISQLLCLGKCHWAIYVVLHMPHRDDYPYLQPKLIREILFQYCESWSSQESQRQFIEDLGVPPAWMHEAMAVYFNYHGDLTKALEHFIGCENWQKAHSIFVTSIAHSLFLSGNHSEIWKVASAMEEYKSEIENWDLGAGIYISFFQLRSSLEEDNNTMSELDSLENKNTACMDFLSHLNESLAVWGNRLPIDARVAYAKMAEEISDLLLYDTSESSTRETQLSCFNAVFSAPIPGDVQSNHMQDAVALFTTYLSEMAA
ncbi:hypothetical protein ACFE04_031625 [Oxalis oulophora]